jgi:hypothetical protein
MSKKIFIGIPTYGDVSAATMCCVLSTLTSCGYPGTLSVYPGCAIIALARSELLGRFLLSDCTHFLFLDSDISFSGNLVKRMMETNVDVVTGIYLSRKTPHEPMFNRLEPYNIITTGNDEKLLEIHSAGLGCVLVSRKAIEDTCKFFPTLEYISRDTEKPSYCLFMEGLGKSPDEEKIRFWGEDIMFFSRLRDAGFHPYAIIDTVINHDGHDYRLSDTLKQEKEDLLKQEKVSKKTRKKK